MGDIRSALQITQFSRTVVCALRKAVENVSQRIGVSYPLAIALDTKGPEIRTGVLADDQNGSKEVSLNNGDRIRLSTDKKFETACTDRLVYVDYENIVAVVRKGDGIYVDDGLILLSAQEVGESWQVDFRKPAHNSGGNSWQMEISVFF